MYDGEEWKDIEGYEGKYQVSNYGRIKTLPDKIRAHNIMKGYHAIALVNDGKTKVFRIARLVLHAFGYPQPSEEYQVSYLDGNKDNLHISNLKWMTPAETMQYATQTGRIKPRSKESIRKTSVALRERWKNEDYRKAESQRSKDRWNDPDKREQILSSMREAGRKRRERNAEIKAAIPVLEPYRVPDLPGEIWKDIEDYDGHYQVSSYGRVKSCDRILPHETHGTWHLKEKLLRQKTSGPNKLKYMSVTFHVGHGKMETKSVHRLVAEAFIPNVNSLPQINHIDGDKTNNHVSNLEWVSEQENVDHAWRTGLCENIVRAKAKPVINLDTGEHFNSVADAERHYGKSAGAIGHVLHGKHERAHGYRWAYAEEE